MLIFQIDAHYTYLHDQYILVWIYRISWIENINNTHTVRINLEKLA